MLIPAGVVDYLFKFQIYFLKDMFKGLKKNGSFYLNSIWRNRFFMSSKVKRNQLINHPGREIKYCIYMIINRPDAIPEAWLFAKFATGQILNAQPPSKGGETFLSSFSFHD
jgi:hypothetical protein